MRKRVECFCKIKIHNIHIMFYVQWVYVCVQDSQQLPFLKMGDNSPIFQPTGIFPRPRDYLKIRYSHPAIICCSSFDTLGEAPSGHGDLFGFILYSVFATFSVVICMSITSQSVWFVNASGMLFVFSLVNTEEKSCVSPHFQFNILNPNPNHKPNPMCTFYMPLLNMLLKYFYETFDRIPRGHIRLKTVIRVPMSL